MSKLVELILSYSRKFDDTTYPQAVYLDLIERISNAQTPSELGEALCHAMSWKDGKVRIDPQGQHNLSFGTTRYTAGNTKPNTLAEAHREIFKSELFFDWACKVRTLNHFTIEPIKEIHHLGLWPSGLVLPVFLLHMLRPQIFPIIDRWVTVAYLRLHPYPSHSCNPKKLSIDDYRSFSAWWLTLLQDAGIQPMSAQLNQLKDIDAGLWSYGKNHASAIETGDDSDDEIECPDNNVRDRNVKFETGSPEFKQRVMALHKQGLRQADAMRKAAQQLGIGPLPNSYERYPGSHFERWRKQGFQ